MILVFRNDRSVSSVSRYADVLRVFSREWFAWHTLAVIRHLDLIALGVEEAPARITVLHNGVLIHHDQAFLGPTSHRSLPKYGAHGPAPIRLQDHGDPVQFRNIWIRPLRTGSDID